MFRRVTLATLSLVTAFAACGRGGPTGPSGTVKVNVNVGGSGPFQLTLQGRSISGPGDYAFDLSPGSHEVSGRLDGTLVSVGVRAPRSDDRGGPVRGSIRNIATAQFALIQDCSIQYDTFTCLVPGQTVPCARGGPGEFRFQFNVTESSSGRCE